MMMVMMMAMTMTMMTNIIPYRRTKTHIWEKVLMGIWVHPIFVVFVISAIIIITSNIIIKPAQLPSQLILVSTHQGLYL